MNEYQYASIWDAIENSAAAAANMKARASLMIALNDHIEKSGWTQAQAAKHFGVTQPRVSDLKRGKIDLFSMDTLVAMLSAAGLELDIQIRAAA